MFLHCHNPVERTTAFGERVIDSFRNEFDFLSNFFLGAPIRWNGQDFSTSEHAYQWAKTNDPTEKESVLFTFHESSGGKLIATPTTPGQAKRMGRAITVREDWEDVRVQMMREILFAKFTQHWGLRQNLILTGDAILVEGNTWHDNFWGSCSCEGCGNKGENMLGKLLMELRDKLRNPYIPCLGCPIQPQSSLAPDAKL